MKAEKIHIGDFVYCRSPYYRGQLELPNELGLVIEIKRNNYKILYANDKRCWLPREAIVQAHPEMRYTTFLEKLNYIIKKLHALDCELTEDPDGVHKVSLRIDSITHETIDDLRAFLAGGFVSLTVVPEGMVFMQTEVRFTA